MEASEISKDFQLLGSPAYYGRGSSSKVGLPCLVTNGIVRACQLGSSTFWLDYEARRGQKMGLKIHQGIQ
jgi:hypothetical protein